jgi:hypothetical protein
VKTEPRSASAARRKSSPAHQKVPTARYDASQPVVNGPSEVGRGGDDLVEFVPDAFIQVFGASFDRARSLALYSSNSGCERTPASRRSESLRNPTSEEWAAFTASCSMRDMGTHLCALPTGEHCSRGLVCLGCVHAQPKKSAAPVFRRMLASHEHELAAARTRGEPAGQIAAREMEVGRIRTALRRAEELAVDVAAAIEACAS